MDFILKLWQILRGVKAHADVAVLHARWVRYVTKKDLYRLKAVAAKAAYEKAAAALPAKVAGQSVGVPSIEVKPLIGE